MVHNELRSNLSSFFTGKGDTIRTAILSISLLGIFGSIIENNYCVERTSDDGNSISLKPDGYCTTNQVADNISMSSTNSEV